MARTEWHKGKFYSYRKATIFICAINIFVAVYLLHTLYHLYFHSASQIVRYTPEQRRRSQESIKIRKAFEPKELIKAVKEMEERDREEESRVNGDLPMHLKRKIGDEILQILRKLNVSANATDLQRQVVEKWRKEKLKEANKVSLVKTLNSTILPVEAGMLVKTLKHNWEKLSEEIGLWIPVEVVNKEHKDKRRNEEDIDGDVLLGKKPPPECNVELHTDYDGVALKWGLNYHKQSAYDCCRACFRQAERAQPGENKCNIWVFCPSFEGCYSPDIYEHKIGECWLKYAEQPKLNFKDKYSKSYRKSHSKAPLVVPWVSGVIST